MLNGVFYNPTKVHFGRGCLQDLGVELHQYTNRVLLLYGCGSIVRNGIYDQVITALKKDKFYYQELAGVVPNPRDDLVHEGIQICRDHNLKFILAVGGGSVIDTAKAIALGLYYDGELFDLFDGGSFPSEVGSVGVVLTVPGSGSESSPDSVISFPAIREKRPVTSPLLYPKFAFLDPVFTLSLNREQTMSGIWDAISHVLERYFTPTTNVDCTDRIGEALIQTLMTGARALNNNLVDYDQRAEVMWASKLAHDNTAGFGRKPDWAVHRIVHEVAATCDTIHGLSLSVLYPAWMEYCCAHKPQRLLQLSESLFGVGECPTVNFHSFLNELGLPTTWSELGIKNKSQLQHIGSKCVERQVSGTIGNYIRLNPEEIIRVVESVYD